MRPKAKPRLGSRGRPEESRKAILQAALREFSREGVAGARTDSIARAAKVNKALLYYYFKDKDALYAAVLDQVFQGLLTAVSEVLDGNLPPKEKFLAYVGAHCDYIAGQAYAPRIVQGEMMRGGRQFARIVERYFKPLFTKLAAVLKAGEVSGDFRRVDPWNFIPSVISVIVFYFNSAPAMRLMINADPLAPERIAQRRKAVLDFISAALFRHPTPTLAGA
ncbi:MAG TPA: TetR/AcrR family transcriptional regulator, partial [Terriglobales bacterium]|nr:TetR/AcrR family transcriptional regulator [Terriglobales bacterium]